MTGRYSKFLKFFHAAGDLLLINISFLLAAQLFRQDYTQSYEDQYRTLLILMNLLWVIVAFFLRIYELNRVISLEKVTVNLFKSLFLHILLIFACLFALKGALYSRFHLLFTYVFYAVALFGWRMLALFLLKKYRESGYNYRKVVIIGAGKTGGLLYDFFKAHANYGYHCDGFFDDYPDKSQHAQLILGNIQEAKPYCEQNQIDEIYCALPLHATEKIQDLIQYADNAMMRLRIVPDFSSFPFRRVNIEFYAGIPVLTFREEPLENLFNRFMKRTFDIIFSLLVIILLFSWLFPIIAILIKLSSRGPVLFKQLRSGKDNQEFLCYKFRTMKVNASADKKQATKDDDRITSIGRFLRKTSMDELPQFFNVLIGNMSVVGPRPHMLQHTKDYSAIIDKFMVRHFVKPGITGMAQVKGYRGETKDPREMELRVRADVWYLENWSFLLDLKLILLTVVNVFKGQEKAY